MNVRFFVAFCLFVTFNYFKTDTFGQELPTLSKIISPAPTAASLGKYGDWPVNEYTGIPSISVPIYEIKLKGLSIPINLSYHASGNKVDEIASWVGLNWSLNAGGVITRSMHGLPDELPGRGFQSQAEKFLNPIIPTEPASYSLLENVANQYYDSEPDEFFYNFLNKSGKFVMDANYTPILIPYKSLKVLFGFNITDENGNQFYFNTLEKTRSEPNDGGDLNIFTYTSSWYLSKIVSADKRDSVFFDYEVTSYQYDTPLNQTWAISNSLYSTCNLLMPLTSSYSAINITGQRLKRIRFSNGSIEFEALHSRTDLIGDAALTAIKIYNSERLIKQFSLSYNYISDRLNLVSLTEKNGFNEALPPYIFTYNTNTLPPRGSFAQDHWGYYNGASNSTFIPEMKQGTTVYPGANREVVPGVVSAGVLEKINYPTGGYTMFEFGCNTYGIDEEGKLIEDTIYSTLNFTHRIKCTGNSGANNTSSFTIAHDQYITYSNNLHYTNSICASGSTATIILKNDLGTVYPLEEGNGKILFLQKGVYTVDGEAQCEACPSLERVLSFSYDGSISSISRYRYGPGLRINKLTTFDGTDLGAKKNTVYSYDVSSDIGRSSGRLLTAPKYHYSSNLVKAGTSSGSTTPPEITCSYFTRTSNSLAILGTTQGGFLGYTEISKVDLDGFNQGVGSTVSEYSFIPAKNKISFPFTPPVNQDHLRGLLIRQRVFDREAKLLKQTINEYTDNSVVGASLKAYKIAYSKKNLISTGLDASTFSFPFYTYRSQWVYLSKSKQIDYGENPQDTVVTLTTYVHGSKNLKPSTINSINSRQETITTNYFYPVDYPLVAPYTGMIANNIIEPVIEEITSKNGIQQKLSRTNYYNPLTDLFVPKNKVYQLYGHSLDTIVQFDQYDNFGNLTVESRPHGTKVCYLWSYRGNYPIAKLENADYSLAVGLLGGSNAVELFAKKVNPTTAEIIAFIAPLRSSPILDNALITTYTYEPLIGMTSSTDAKGMTTYYEYDNFQRLKAIKDQNGHVIKSYDYHYKP